MVLEYEIVDHHPPRLNLLFLICKEIHKFLSENEENVVAVNCRAGKGRTGTIICCYLIFCGRFDDANKAFDYYSKKRFSKGEGVTQPAQKRYVQYFEKLCKEKIFFPLVIGITNISINKFPSNEITDVITPYFEIYLQNSDKVSFTTKTSFYDQRKIYPNNTTELISLSDNNFVVRVCGDVTIKMYNNGILSSKKLGRISFNTAFLNKDKNELIFNIYEIDPDKLARKKYVPKDFEIHYCNCENSKYPLEICDQCEDFLKLELKDWKEIEEILKFHEKNIERSKVLLFKNPSEDDCDLVLKSVYNEQNDLNNTEFIDSLNEERNTELSNEKKTYDVVKDRKNDSNTEKRTPERYEKDNKMEKIKDSSFENECKVI